MSLKFCEVIIVILAISEEEGFFILKGTYSEKKKSPFELFYTNIYEFDVHTNPPQC